MVLTAKDLIKYRPIGFRIIKNMKFKYIKPQDRSDLLQAIYIGIWQGLSQYNKQKNPKKKKEAFLYIQIRRSIVDFFRSLESRRLIEKKKK